MGTGPKEQREGAPAIQIWGMLNVEKNNADNLWMKQIVFWVHSDK